MNPILIQRMRALLVLKQYIEIYKLLALVYHSLEKRIRPVSDIVKYSPFNQRISKTVNGDTEYYVYEAPEMEADVVADYDDSLNLKAKYIMHPERVDKPIIKKQNSIINYYNKNGLGSVLSILNGNAIVKNTYKYYAFGETKSKIVTIENRYQYTSREKEKENDNYYYRSRLFSPLSGRFIQKDKYFQKFISLINLFIKLENKSGTKTKIYHYHILNNNVFNEILNSENRVYIYVNNNAINNTDPNGYITKSKSYRKNWSIICNCDDGDVSEGDWICGSCYWKTYSSGCYEVKDCTKTTTWNDCICQSYYRGNPYGDPYESSFEETEAETYWCYYDPNDEE